MTKISPLKAIRLKCLDCSAGQPKEVKLCRAIDCSLYPFRMGKNPNRARVGNGKGDFIKNSPTESKISEVKQDKSLITQLEGDNSIRQKIIS